MSDEVHAQIDAVRAALDRLDQEAERAARVPEGLRDLGLAVDALRRSLWAILTAQNAGDFPQYLGRVRLQRARTFYEDVLSDLYAEGLSPNAPGLEEFRDTVRAVSEACREMSL